MSETSSSGASPTLYEKLWENLNHKEINTPFVAPKLPHFANPTTQRAEFPIIYYWDGFQAQIVNLSQAEVNAIFPEPIGKTAEIKGDIRSSYLLCTSMTPLSNVDIVFSDREIGVYYWPDFQRQVENPSYAGTNDRIWRPKSSQLVVGPMGIKEDVRSLRAFFSQRTYLSEADVVLAHANPGTAITEFTQLRKSQVENQRLEISEQFGILSQREDNWDGRGSQKPTDLTLAHANEVMEALLNFVISAGYHWDTPSISSDGDGNVTVVWYKDERQLHFQIGEHEAEYFRVWGTNINTEMDVDFLRPEHYLILWKWLIYGLPFPPDIGATHHLSPAMETAM